MFWVKKGGNSSGAQLGDREACHWDSRPLPPGASGAQPWASTAAGDVRRADSGVRGGGGNGNRHSGGGRDGDGGGSGWGGGNSGDATGVTTAAASPEEEESGGDDSSSDGGASNDDDDHPQVSQPVRPKRLAPLTLNP